MIAIHSFLGVMVEVIFWLAGNGVLESRLGLLYLPLRPIYGIGGVACTLFTHRFTQEPILIFLRADRQSGRVRRHLDLVRKSQHDL